MSSSATLPMPQEEYPPRADLRKELSKPLPFIPLGTVDAASVGDDEAIKQALAVLDTFNAAVATHDEKTLASCFYADQSYWRDILALTSHLRTFTGSDIVAPAFLATEKLGAYAADGLTLAAAKFIPATPVLQFIDCSVVFRTNAPAAMCSGRLILLPVKTKGSDGTDTLAWKIWILSTWIENLDVQSEDEKLLQSLGRKFDDTEVFETDVLIIGGGNSGISLAARLKALGVDSVMIDKNPRVGDNWGFRYDCLQLHTPTSSCEMPYLRYPKDKQTPHHVTKDELAEHLRTYVATFDLNVITSANVLFTVYDQVKKRWTVKFQALGGIKTAICKELVQATGIGSTKPRLPAMSDAHLYRGTSLHSTKYRNGKLLVEQGAKSVIVIGSANTAFDIVQDCHHAGLQTTMVARSTTWLFPVEYIHDDHALGAYDKMPIEVVDKVFMTIPVPVESQLVRGLWSHLASMEPYRYRALAAAGFPVIDSRHPDADLNHQLIERAGGHYVDTGECVPLISEGKVGVRGGVEPVAYTQTGLCFSDGSTADADVIVWCTGFADQDVRDVVSDILGGGQSDIKSNTLGPDDVAARLDATWALDAEGEIRGMWKRHLRIDNYWVMGGNTQQQRWWSRVLAQQIKMSLEGILPPAYRDTPKPLK